MKRLLTLLILIIVFNSNSQTEICSNQNFVKIDVVDIETGKFIDDFDILLIYQGDTTIFRNDPNLLQDNLLLKLDKNYVGSITLLIRTKENGIIANYSFQAGYNFLEEIEVILYPKNMKKRISKDLDKFYNRKFNKFKTFENFIYSYGIDKMPFLKN